METIDYSHGGGLPNVQTVDYHHGQPSRGGGDPGYRDRPPPMRMHEYPPGTSPEYKLTPYLMWNGIRQLFSLIPILHSFVIHVILWLLYSLPGSGPHPYDHPPDYPPPGYPPYPGFPREGFPPGPPGMFPYPPFGGPGAYFPPGFDPAAIFAAYTEQTGTACRDVAVIFVFLCFG